MATTRSYHHPELLQLWDLKLDCPQGDHSHLCLTALLQGHVLYEVINISNLPLPVFLSLQDRPTYQPIDLFLKLGRPSAPSIVPSIENLALDQIAKQPAQLPLHR